MGKLHCLVPVVYDVHQPGSAYGDENSMLKIRDI